MVARVAQQALGVRLMPAQAQKELLPLAGLKLDGAYGLRMDQQRRGRSFGRQVPEAESDTLARSEQVCCLNQRL